MTHFDNLTEREQSFRALQQNPSEYAKWAKGVRKVWAESPAGLLAILRLKEGK